MRDFWLGFAILMVFFTVYSFSAGDQIAFVLGIVAILSSLLLWANEL